MNPLAYAVGTFVVVLGATLVSGLLVLRFWPAVRRERLRRDDRDGRIRLILRFGTEPAIGAAQRAIEKIGRNVVPKDATLSDPLPGSPGAGRDSRSPRHHHPLGRQARLRAHRPCRLSLLRFSRPAAALEHAARVTRLLCGGFLLPDFWLYNRIKERQRAILNALPDVLDLLMVCVEAGLGFDSAVARRGRAGRADPEPASTRSSCACTWKSGPDGRAMRPSARWASAAASRKYVPW